MVSKVKNQQKFIDQLRNSKDPETAPKGRGYFITWADGRARVGYKRKQDATDFINQDSAGMDVVQVEYREAEKSERVRNKFTEASARTYQIMKKAWDNPPRDEAHYPGSNTGSGGGVPREMPKAPGNMPRKDQGKGLSDTYFTPSTLDREPEEKHQKTEPTGQSTQEQNAPDDDPWGPSNKLRKVKPNQYRPFDRPEFNEDYSQYTQRQFGLNMRKHKKFALSMKKAQQAPNWADPKQLGSALYDQIKDELQTYADQIQENSVFAENIVNNTIPESIEQNQDRFIELGITLPIMLEGIKEVARLLMAHDQIAMDTLPSEQGATKFLLEPKQPSSQIPQMPAEESEFLNNHTSDEIWDIVRNPETESTPEGQMARSLIQKGIVASRLNMKKISKVSPKYDHSTVQTSDISETVINAIKDIQKNIDKDKLYDGEDEPGWTENGLQKLFHTTILFGVKDNVKDEVKKVFDTHKPVHIETMGVEYFDTNPDFDVVIVRCKSEELTKIHNELKDTLENKDSYPNYKPHITIAYLKKGEKLDDTQISDISWEMDSLEISTSDGQLEKVSALAIPIRESLDYPHSWSKKKKKKEVVPEKEKKILQMDSTKLNMKKAQEDNYTDDDYKYSYGFQAPGFIDALSDITEGYDFGGSEGPFHKNLTIVDVGSPDEFDYPGGKNLIEGDLETPLNLEPRAFINISDVIATLGHPGISGEDYAKIAPQVADNINRALLPGGKVRLLDSIDSLRPILDYLTNLGYTKVWDYMYEEGYEDIDGFEDEDEDSSYRYDIILQKPQVKKASILDEPRASLDSAIWDIGRDDLPMLKPDVKIHIVENFLSYISQFGGYIKPEEWIKNMFYTGSTATYTYNDTSDIDIHIIVDWIDLAALNPDKARKDLKEMWQELHDVFWWTLNKLKLPGTKHPLTYYVMPPGDEKKLIDMKEEVYDIGHEVWLIPPGKAMDLTKEVIDPALEEASEFIARINQHIADARKGVIDYVLLQEVITSENAATRYIQIADKIKEIDEHLKELKDEYATLKKKRQEAFETGDSLVGGNSNYSLGNIIFKIVERYKYMDVLRKIKQITDGMDLRPDQIEEIANVLGLDLED